MSESFRWAINRAGQRADNPCLAHRWLVGSKMLFPVAMLIASPLCLAAGTVLAKALVSGIEPVTFLVVQLGASVIFLWTIAATQGLLRIALGAVASLVGLGLTVGLASICTILALRFTTASQASVIFAIQPVLIAVFAWAVLGERPTWTLLALSFLALSGVAAVASAGTASDETTFSGNLLALFSTALAALYVVWMRKLTTTEHPLTSLVVLQATALAVALIALPIAKTFTASQADAPRLITWIAAALAGILQYGLGYWLYLLGLQKVKAGVAGIYLNLVPIFVIGFAFLFLGESLSARQWAGAATVLVAVTGFSLFALLGERGDMGSSSRDTARGKS